MPIDYAALGTGQDIRQALDKLVVPHLRGDQEVKEAILAAVEKLETRLNTARRTAWVAVPIAWSEVMAGDVIVAKDGALLAVLGVERGGPWVLHLRDTDLRTSDPDHPVPVLRRPTADALDILTRQLGAQVTT